MRISVGVNSIVYWMPVIDWNRAYSAVILIIWFVTLLYGVLLIMLWCRHLLFVMVWCKLRIHLRCVELIQHCLLFLSLSRTLYLHWCSNSSALSKFLFPSRCNWTLILFVRLVVWRFRLFIVDVWWLHLLVFLSTIDIVVYTI
jgi:hypothetical protein